MRLLRTLSLVLAAAAISNAMGDRTVFDTTSPPPTPNPRKAAPFVAALELGVNSLASVLGARATWYPIQQLAIDAGGSWSTAGLRGGFGARWFTSDSFSSPFIGAAWKRSAGIDSASLDDGKQSVSAVTIFPLQWIDAEVGYEIRHPDGLVVVLTTGWSFPLTSHRSEVVSGTLSKDGKDNLDWYTGGGPIFAAAVGIGF
jgi:hypothetical protein